MPHFGIDPERYEGYDKEEELEGSELPPWRDSRSSGGEQTDIRRWIASLDQARRMFGHHRDATHNDDSE